MQTIRNNNSILEKFKRIYSMFLNDKLALISIIFLIFILIIAIFGPSLTSNSFTKMNLRLRNLAPFSFDHRFVFTVKQGI